MPDNKRIRDIPTRNIDFQVDTIRVDDPTWAAGYFSPDENTITCNYRRGTDSDYHESEELLIHEQNHRDNSAAGLYEYPVSPEQAYKINMHDEMAARLRELRFENAQRSSGNIMPTKITALHLVNLLEGSVNHYG